MIYDLECLELRGSSKQLGGAHGEHFRQRIVEFIDMRLDALVVYARERGIDKVQPMQDLAAASLARLERWHPEGYLEHGAVAAGARVDPVRLHWVAQMTDLRDAYLLAAPKGPARPAQAAEGCSAVLIPSSHTADGQALAGQTWDLNPPDVDFVVAFDRRPSQRPRTLAVTCVGCPSLVGLNDAGLAVGTTNIKTYGAGAGVGYLNVLHRLLEAPSAEAAASLLRTAPLAAAHTYWAVDKSLQLEFEASPQAIIERNTASGPLARTNHCFSAQHRQIEGEEPSLSSLRRLQRLETATQSPAIDVEFLRQLFADRSEGIHSINRYPEDAQGTATNAVVIVRPAEHRLWACRGPADRGQWREWTLAD